MASAALAQQRGPLSGTKLVIAGFICALSNFMVVLDTTIANVSVPHIASALATSASQGTWVITSYAVAEAISVPLTGWLAGRFGTVRTFVFGMIGFGIFSVLCGLSTSLGMLLACRIGQGLCGGPIMPLSQTLLLSIFPRKQHAQAMGLWAMTTVVAPILGPILGGHISDGWSWHWIFFINVPVVAICVGGAIMMLKGSETPTQKLPIDRVGLGLMILWIAALQIMLDLGYERDWFSDSTIVMLAIIAFVGFLVFLVWELTEANPIVDLTVFRHRGFAAAVAALFFGFGTFFASAVVIPQWLQLSLDYTATDAGYVMAVTGMSAVVMSPVAAKLTEKVDPRLLVCFGILWLGAMALLRTQWTSGAGFWSLALPQLLQGIGLPFFFVPVTTLALGSVRPEETASAAGVMNFLRTMSGAIMASIAITFWRDSARTARDGVVGSLHPEQAEQALLGQGMSLDQIRLLVEGLVNRESLAIAMNHTFEVAALIFAVSALIIWLAPKPKRMTGPVVGAH